MTAEALAATAAFLAGVVSVNTFTKNKGPNDVFERFGSEQEATESAAQNKLIPRPGHETQPKWIAELGVVDRTRLGRYNKYYTHRMLIITSPGTREWLKQFEIKANEPGRYAIPAEYLDEFNSVVVSILASKVGGR